MKSNVTLLAKDSVKYGLIPVARRFIALFLVPVYTRRLTPADYGIANVIGTASSLLEKFMTWGMSGAFFRYYHECDQKEKITMVSTIQNFRLITSFILCVGLSLASKYVASILLFDIKYYNLILLSLATIFFSTVSNLAFDILRADFRIMWYNSIQIGGFITQILLSIVFIILLNYGLLGMFLANMISEVIICLISLYLIRNLLSLNINMGVLRKSLAFGIGFLPSEFGAWITSASDRIFLSRFVTLSNIGIYSISNQLSNVLQFFTGAFRQAWVPIAYRDYRKDEAPEFFRKTSIYYTMILSIVILTCSLFSSDALHILTTKAYYKAYLYVPILALGVAFNGLSIMIAEGLNFAKKPFYRSLVLIIGAFTNLSLNFFFIPRFGILGASITTALAYFVCLISAFLLARRFYDRIKYNLGKIMLILSFNIAFIIVGILLDKNYSVFNIIYKFALLAIASIGMTYIFSKRDVKYIIERLKQLYVYKTNKT